MPQKRSEYDDYLKFIDNALELAQKLPKYFSKFSNKIYCNHQKLAVYILMQKLKLTTRGIVAYLRSNPDARLHLGLFHVPVHTTIVRFYAKIKNSIGSMLDLRQATTVAVDATGFEMEAKSFYYRTRWNSERQWKTKRHMKLSIAIDTAKQLILTYKIRRKPRHDTKDFKLLLKDIVCTHVVADKGYDDHKLRRFVFHTLKATPIIPKRRSHHFYGYIRGKQKIDGKNYHQRSKVETVFSVIKRKYGSVLRCKSYATQQTELISKMITYNLDRRLNYLLLIIKGCTKAREWAGNLLSVFSRASFRNAFMDKKTKVRMSIIGFKFCVKALPANSPDHFIGLFRRHSHFRCVRAKIEFVFIDKIHL